MTCPSSACRSLPLTECGQADCPYCTPTLDDSGFEEVALPWKKTATIAARGAEQEVGRLVIVGPGTMTASDGTLAAARCSITVDGKKVAESKDDSGTPCSYKLK